MPASNQLELVKRGVLFTVSLFVFGTIAIFLIRGTPLGDSFVHAAELILQAELSDPNPFMRVVNVVLGTFGVLMLWVWGWALLDFLMSGGLGEIMGASRQKSEIARLRGHYIICGAGRTGEVIAELLEKSGKKFVFLDRNPKVLESFSKKYYIVAGDVTDEEALKECGIKYAAGLFSVVNSDSENLITVLIAHEMRPDLPICARASTKQYITRIKDAGATFVVSPAMVCGEDLTLKMMGKQPKKQKL